MRLGIYDLLEPLLERHVAHYAENWEEDEAELLANAGWAPSPAVTQRLMLLVAFYERELHFVQSDPAIDGLVEVFRHNKEHYSKITASLLPILSMLTTGKLAG